jgi:hypothetical protein
MDIIRHCRRKEAMMENNVETLKQEQGKQDNYEQNHKSPHHHLVDINFDGAMRQIEKDKYLVSALKSKLGVPTDYELDLVVDGQFMPLADDAEIKIKGGEVLVSHVRRGGSS